MSYTQNLTKKSLFTLLTLTQISFAFASPIFGGAPIAPSNLTTTAPTTRLSQQYVPITLNWADNSTDEDSFVIYAYYSYGSSSGQILNASGTPITLSLPANTTSYTIDTTSFNKIPATTTPIYFIMNAINSNGPSLSTASIPTVFVTPVTAPTSVTGTGSKYLTIVNNRAVYKGKVNLSWTQVTGATNYMIQRVIVGSTQAPVSFTVGTSTTFVDTTVTLNTSYRYSVKTMSGVDSSSYTSSATITVPK